MMEYVGYTVYILPEDTFPGDYSVRFDNLTRDEVDELEEIVLGSSYDMLIKPVKKGK